MYIHIYINFPRAEALALHARFEKNTRPVRQVHVSRHNGGSIGAP